MGGWNFRSHDDDDVLEWIKTYKEPNKAIEKLMSMADEEGLTDLPHAPIGFNKIFIGIVSYAIYEEKPIEKKYLEVVLKIARQLVKDESYLSTWSSKAERRRALLKEIYLIEWDLKS